MKNNGAVPLKILAICKAINVLMLSWTSTRCLHNGKIQSRMFCNIVPTAQTTCEPCLYHEKITVEITKSNSSYPFSLPSAQFSGFFRCSDLQQFAADRFAMSDLVIDRRKFVKIKSLLLVKTMQEPYLSPPTTQTAHVPVRAFSSS